MSAVWITHVWLVVVWMALWGDLSVANLLGGIIAAFLATRIIPARPASGLLTVRPLALLRLGLYFVWKMVEASAIVAWEVVTPRNRIPEGIVAVPVLYASSEDSGRSNRLILLGGIAWLVLVLVNWGMSIFVV